MKALVVMPATIEALELCDGLSAQGFEVSHAPSGLYALTLLERDRPDLVVSSDDIADMTGRELLEILNEDGGQAITFILMTAQPPSDLPANAIIVPPEAMVIELLTRAGIAEVEDASEIDEIDPSDTLEIDHLGANDLEYTLEGEAEPTGETALEAARQTTPETPVSELSSGQFKFENQGFIHLVRWLSSLAEFSKVELHCGPSVGWMYFVRGALSHAEFGRQRGEDAVRGLFLAAADHQGGSFSLESIDPTTAANLPLSISRPITQIVLTWSA